MYKDNDHYMNAYQELADVLAENGKSLFQIEWIATKEGAIDINFFLLVCEGTFYINPSSCGTMDPHLIVAGKDFWLSREQATVSNDVDHWCFHRMPQEPPKRVSSITLFKTYPKKEKIKW